MSSKLVKKSIKWQAKTSDEKLALEIVQKLSKAGFNHTYIVGGYVRDLLLARKDTGAIDIATEATPQRVTKVLGKQYRIIPTGLKHGTVTVHSGKIDIEITTFRIESKYINHRRPKAVKFIADPRLDSSRRDFTVNALYLDPIKKEILDFQSGLYDLQKKQLHFVGNAQERIDEDALRILRAVRFASTLEFRLEKKDLIAIRKNAKLISTVSAERVKQELDKIMLSQNRSVGIQLLLQTGLLKIIMPEVEDLNRIPHSKNYHSEGNVFVHTMLALRLIQPDADLNCMYGALFHDLGKAKTFKRVTREGRRHMTYYNHQYVGAELARKIMKRLKFSNHDIAEISWYVDHHLVPFGLSHMRPGKQMSWALDSKFENLLKVYRADSLASIPSDKFGKQLKPSLQSYNYSMKVLEKAKSQPKLQKPLISGNDVMKLLKIKPGPRVGEVLAKIREQQLSGKLETKQQALKYAKLTK